MIRIAAVGDVHYDKSSKHRLREHFRGLGGKADLLLIAGDLTQSGDLEEAEALREDLRECPIPIVLVLGNHDFHQGREREIMECFRSIGMTVLEGQSARLRVREFDVGIVGLKGFGGGFVGASVTEFGEFEMKLFARQAKTQAEILRRELGQLDTDYRFVLLHVSPVEGTLLGERREIFPFLGSYLFSEAIDSCGADAVFHGHAHLGTERGMTPRGIPVRNVALPVIRHAYNVYQFDQPRMSRPTAEGTPPVAKTPDFR